MRKKYQSQTTLNSKEIKQKGNLESLRGLPQSHAHPQKWAKYVYSAIDFSCPQVTDATTPMSHIFSVYDPISRMLDRPGYFRAQNFNEELVNYGNPMNDGQKNLLNSSKKKLKALGMERKMIKQIVAAAKASGTAICKVLTEATT